ncbi:MAG TPA: hypothetical protein VLE89_01425 [Chlamydiales bacterium]|nr:hypothetical protein [Chlamydiales bacterium]
MNAVEFDPVVAALPNGEMEKEEPIPEALEAISVRQESCHRMGVVNGMDASLEQAVSHAEYLKSFASGESIDCIYNRTHGAWTDLIEVFCLNYFGYSPNTAKQLQEKWSLFHCENSDRINAKYLQFCHSQGTLSVRNGLASLSEEIRNRVIVVAIAPAGIVPNDLCYNSFNYASRKDPIPFGELLFAGALDPNEWGASKKVERVLAYREQLILLDSHPEAMGIDHDFQSPTFRKVISDHIHEYLACNGEYS